MHANFPTPNHHRHPNPKFEPYWNTPRFLNSSRIAFAADLINDHRILRRITNHASAKFGFIADARTPQFLCAPIVDISMTCFVCRPTNWWWAHFFSRPSTGKLNFYHIAEISRPHESEYNFGDCFGVLIYVILLKVFFSCWSIIKFLFNF